MHLLNRPKHGCTRLLAVALALASTAPAAQAAEGTAISNGDNAWMLVCTALVLMMTAPGLTLFYGGLVRGKNVLGTMMHSMVLMAVVSVLWVLFDKRRDAHGDGS